MAKNRHANNIHIVSKIAKRVAGGERDFGRVAVKEDGDYVLLNYLPSATYSHDMTRTEEACRGLVIRTDGKVMALSMPKFYNLNQRECPHLPDEPYEVWEKVDGCFLGRMKLNLWDGSTISIKDVVKNKLKVKLIGMDEHGNLVPCEVIEWFDNGSKDDWLLITVDCPVSKASGGGNRGNHIVVTPNHHIWLNGEFQPAVMAKAGDEVVSYEYMPSPSVLKMMEAGLLGDGCVTPMHSTFRYQEPHTDKHQEYTHELRRWLGECVQAMRTTKSGYGSTMLWANSRCYKSLEMLREKWYPRGKKAVPSNLDWVDDFAVAKWYMDDGSLAHWKGQQDRAYFATNSFSYGGVKRLAERLSQMYGVSCTVFNSKGWNIRVNAGRHGEINRFWEAIAPHIVSCMKYKLPQGYRDVPYRSYPTGKQDAGIAKAKVLNVCVLVGNTVDKNSGHTYFHSGKKGFDVKTTTGNYFAKGILVHNSLILSWHDGRQWRHNTRGSFANEYGEFAQAWWTENVDISDMPLHWTVMTEACFLADPMPRAVYKPEGLYLIAIRDRHSGQDMSIQGMDINGLSRVTNYSYTIEDLLDSRENLEGTEGWVVRFDSGVRVKIKTAWYLRLFRAMQSLTPKNIRALMVEVGENWIDEFPDDLRPDANAIQEKIEEQLRAALARIFKAYSKVAHIESRKEYALAVMQDYADVSSWLFNLRDGKFDEFEVLKRLDLTV